MREADIEEVTEFVRRYCSVDNAEDGAQDDDQARGAGRFVFAQGKNSRSARKARAPVAWGPVERCTVEVLRRVRELSTSGEGHVYLRAYGEGDTSPIAEIRIMGTTDEAEEDTPPSDNAVACLTWALVRTNTQLLGDNADLRRALDRHHQLAVEMTEQFTLVTTHAKMLEDSEGAESMAIAMQALTPTLEKLAPAFLSWMGAGGGLPDAPLERMQEGVRRIMVMVDDVGKTIRANPDVAASNPTVLQPLTALMLQLGPLLGLQVTPMQAATAGAT